MSNLLMSTLPLFLLLLLFNLPRSSLSLNVNFVTGNAMKVSEMSSLLKEAGATVTLNHVKVDLPEIQSAEISAIPKQKAALGAQLSGGATVCEDSSLCFHALGGMPGPFIKFFQTSLGCQGLYNILAAYEDKSATAVCSLAFCPAVHADPVVFEGVVEGRVVDPSDPKWNLPGDAKGFGWGEQKREGGKREKGRERGRERERERRSETAKENKRSALAREHTFC